MHFWQCPYKSGIILLRYRFKFHGIATWISEMLVILCPSDADSVLKRGLFSHVSMKSAYNCVQYCFGSSLRGWETNVAQNLLSPKSSFAMFQKVSRRKFNSIAIIRTDKHWSPNNNCRTLSTFVVFLLVAGLSLAMFISHAFTIFTKVFEPMKYCLTRNSFISINIWQHLASFCSSLAQF